MRENLYIVTGKSGSGKTHFLEHKKFQSVAGVIAPGVWKDGEKIGIDNILLPDNKVVHLATKKPLDSAGYSRKWKFDDDALEVVNKHFLTISNYQTLIVDELGPLELEQGRGLTNAVSLLKELPCKEAYIVVRPSLLDIAKKTFAMWPIIKILEV